MRKLKTFFGRARVLLLAAAALLLSVPIASRADWPFPPDITPNCTNSGYGQNPQMADCVYWYCDTFVGGSPYYPPGFLACCRAIHGDWYTPVCTNMTGGPCGDAICHGHATYREGYGWSVFNHLPSECYSWYYGETQNIYVAWAFCNEYDSCTAMIIDP